VPESKKRQEVSREVARLLKAEREKKRLSMTVVAARAGLSQQMVSYVERGMRNPTLDTLLRMTDALEMDLPRLLKRAFALSCSK
jgi:transcriptional regulator with XRE-family HTH domain